MPGPTIKPPNGAQMKLIEQSASLAAAQFDLAEEIVQSRMPTVNSSERMILIGAVLHAIALNAHAGVTAR